VSDPATGRAPGDRIRVLHVDDHSDFAEVAARLLERESDRVETVAVAGASEALDALADGEFDCVVSDYDMPDADGLAFLEAVRAEYPDLPFVLFTGTGSEAVASEAISAGVTAYLRKGDAGQYELLANRVENAVAQHRAERQAASAERRLRELTDAADDLLWMFSGDWSELLFVNSAYEELWGRSAEALETDPADFLAGIHPDDRAGVREAMERLSAGHQVEMEYRVNEAEEYGRWVWVKGEPITDEDGAVVRVAGFVRDVTERKERERKLREEWAFVDQSLDALDDAFLVFDPEGEIVRWNDRLRTVTGYADAEIAEMEPIDFFPEDHRDRVLDGLREVLETGVVRLRADVLTREGERIPHEFRGQRLTDAGGDLLGFAGIGRDVTERLERERELERTNERLERFAGVVSHDLRSPLEALRASLELAERTEDADHLRSAREQVDRMDTLVDDLLALARRGYTLDEDRVEFVDLASFVEDCGDAMAVDARLSVETDRRVRADPGRLRQVVANLLRNAVEHGDADVVTVGDRDAGFYVADDGTGIAPEDHDRVFEAGYSSAETGTGLGLSIVRRLAEAHGWTVHVDESEGGGTRFDVTGVETAPRIEE